MIEFDSKSIGNATPVANWIKAMENAFSDTASGKIVVPARSHIEHKGNMLLLMPCFGEKFFSTKLVTVFPENPGKQKPVIYGTVVLNDGETGEPLAIFDGGKLTAMRTAAVGSIGIKHLSPPDARSIGVIGLGIQGFHQALFAASQKKIDRIRIYDSSKEVMIRFRERFKTFYSDIKVELCSNTRDLCKESEIIITATGSLKPVIPDLEECWKGKTIIAIGSYKPDMKELPDSLFKSVSQVFVDTHHGLTESGDLIDPIQKGFITPEQVYSMNDVIIGKIQLAGNTRLFKSVGMAAFDLYAAMLVYKNHTE